MQTAYRRIQRLRRNPYLKLQPYAKQTAFLLDPRLDGLYGGSAGGGKSAALLMAALEFAETPGYAALLLRRTYADLNLPKALIPLSQEWLQGTNAKWNSDSRTWTFPSGATVTFGYLEHEDDKYRYQGAAFDLIGWDELTQFSEAQFRYLFSRLRRLKGSEVPPRVRATSNPGGKGHDWVRQRYMDTPDPNRFFLPAGLKDNPALDAEQYILSLSELDPVTRRQLLDGDWTARQAGGKFQRDWFSIVDRVPERERTVRFWDLAATEAKPGKDPDWTVGARMSRTTEGQYVIEDIRRLRGKPIDVEREIRGCAQVDGLEIEIYMEQEPGSSGVNNIDHYRRTVLPEFTFYGERSTGAKEVRANPLSSQSAAGNVSLLRGEWNHAFLDEMEAFPMGSHDDQVDAASGAFAKLHEGDSWVMAV